MPGPYGIARESTVARKLRNEAKAAVLSMTGKLRNEARQTTQGDRLPHKADLRNEPNLLGRRAVQQTCSL